MGHGSPQRQGQEPDHDVAAHVFFGAREHRSYHQSTLELVNRALHLPQPFVGQGTSAAASSVLVLSTDLPSSRAPLPDYLLLQHQIPLPLAIHEPPEPTEHDEGLRPLVLQVFSDPPP